MEFALAAQAGQYHKFDQLMQMVEFILTNEDELIWKMKCALKEVLSNYREHGYKLDPEKWISLRIDVRNEEVEAVIITSCPMWRPTGTVYIPHAQDELNRLAEICSERGRGTFMVCLTTDFFRYERGGQVTILRWNRSVTR